MKERVSAATNSTEMSVSTASINNSNHKKTDTHDDTNATKKSINDTKNVKIGATGLEDGASVHDKMKSMRQNMRVSRHASGGGASKQSVASASNNQTPNHLPSASTSKQNQDGNNSPNSQNNNGIPTDRYSNRSSQSSSLWGSFLRHGRRLYGSTVSVASSITLTEFAGESSERDWDLDPREFEDAAIASDSVPTLPQRHASLNISSSNYSNFLESSEHGSVNNNNSNHQSTSRGGGSHSPVPGYRRTKTAPADFSPIKPGRKTSMHYDSEHGSPASGGAGGGDNNLKQMRRSVESADSMATPRISHLQKDWLLQNATLNNSQGSNLTDASGSTSKLSTTSSKVLDNSSSSNQSSKGSLRFARRKHHHHRCPGIASSTTTADSGKSSKGDMQPTYPSRKQSGTLSILKEDASQLDQMYEENEMAELEQQHQEVVADVTKQHLLLLQEALERMNLMGDFKHDDHETADSTGAIHCPKRTHFTGAQAINVMMEQNLVFTREEAIALGLEWQECGHLTHMNDSGVSFCDSSSEQFKFVLDPEQEVPSSN